MYRKERNGTRKKETSSLVLDSHVEWRICVLAEMERKQREEKVRDRRGSWEGEGGKVGRFYLRVGVKLKVPG